MYMIILYLYFVLNCIFLQKGQCLANERAVLGVGYHVNYSFLIHQITTHGLNDSTF